MVLQRKVFSLEIVMAFLFYTAHITEGNPETHSDQDPCHDFTVGNEEKMEFYSPNYPDKYPKNIRCTKTITAPKGQTVTIDFREKFSVEPSDDCIYDYLEIRDGPYGYSDKLGRFCGLTFPNSQIRSKGESLWLEFISDGSIEHDGFRAVYIFNPIIGSHHSPDHKCSFTRGDIQGFINYTDISQRLINDTADQNKKFECIWKVQAPANQHISIKFLQFELPAPNQCDVNLFEIYNESLSLRGRKGRFCGTKADSQLITQRVAYIRFEASPAEYGKKNDENKDKNFFSLVYTIQRPRHEPAGCDSTEFDCGDGYCIPISLKCNGIENCKYKYDEENCELGASLASVLSSSQMISILIVFIVMVLGMCTSLAISCYAKVKKRKEKEREYRERRSKEASAECGLDPESERGVDPTQAPEIGSRRKAAKWLENVDEDNGCYVPEVDLSVFRKEPSGDDTIPRVEETSLQNIYPEPKRPQNKPPPYSEVRDFSRSSPPPLPPHRNRERLPGHPEQTHPLPPKPPLTRVRQTPTPVNRAAIATVEDDNNDQTVQPPPNQIHAQAVIETPLDRSRERSFESTTSAPDVIVNR